MWTNENRARYDLSGLRYPSDVTDAEWALIGPLIPPGDYQDFRVWPERLNTFRPSLA